MYLQKIKQEKIFQLNYIDICTASFGSQQFVWTQKTRSWDSINLKLQHFCTILDSLFSGKMQSHILISDKRLVLPELSDGDPVSVNIFSAAILGGYKAWLWDMIVQE